MSLTLRQLSYNLLARVTINGLLDIKASKMQNYITKLICKYKCIVDLNN